jgi:pilus assembly protein Flp/PilA
MVLARREDGQGLVEYALILVLVAVVVIAILLVLGPAVGEVFSTVTMALDPGGTGGAVDDTESFRIEDGNGTDPEAYYREYPDS